MLYHHNEFTCKYELSYNMDNIFKKCEKLLELYFSFKVQYKYLEFYAFSTFYTVEMAKKTPGYTKFVEELCQIKVKKFYRFKPFFYKNMVDFMRFFQKYPNELQTKFLRSLGNFLPDVDIPLLFLKISQPF